MIVLPRLAMYACVKLTCIIHIFNIRKGRYEILHFVLFPRCNTPDAQKTLVLIVYLEKSMREKYTDRVRAEGSKAKKKSKFLANCRRRRIVFVEFRVMRRQKKKKIRTERASRKSNARE